MVQGDLNDHGSLVAALKQVDIVISVVGGAVLLDGQLKLIEAIKEVGHIKVNIQLKIPQANFVDLVELFSLYSINDLVSVES